MGYPQRGGRLAPIGGCTWQLTLQIEIATYSTRALRKCATPDPYANYGC
jgi:hypothetical protein